MSTEGKVVGAAPGPPDDPQGLQQEIERTREHLGETVEALVAKVDVKARAQDEASRLIGRLKARVIEARQQAAARAGRGATAGGRQDRRATAEGDRPGPPRATSGRRHDGRAAAAGGVGRRLGQVKPQAAAVAAGISKVTPEQVKQAAGNAAATARRRRTPLLAAVGAVGAGLVGWLLFQRWRRRG